MSAPTSPSGPPSDVGLPARKAALALFAAGLESRGGFDAALSLPAVSGGQSDAAGLAADPDGHARAEKEVA